MLHGAPPYKHWYRQAVTHTHTHAPTNNASKMQADTTKKLTKEAPSTFQAYKLQTLASILVSKVSSQCTAESNNHAPPPALAHLRRCYLALCQVGLKARALPHTRPTVRPSMANCCAGLSKAPHFNYTARLATNHGEPTQPGNPQGQHTIASGPSEKPQSLQKYLTMASSQQFKH